LFTLISVNHMTRYNVLGTNGSDFHAGNKLRVEEQLKILSDKVEHEVADKVTELIRKHGCEHFYVDMGTNIGVQIRKLYEPEKYPSAPVHAVFENYFGSGQRCKVCSVGFEPNSAHRRKNDRVQQALANVGFGVVILPVAASSYTGHATFAKPGVEVDTHEDWGGSIAAAQSVQAGNTFVSTVARVNVANVIRHMRAHLDTNNGTGKIVAKCDIEGSEFELLQSLILSQTICLIDYMYIEWHPIKEQTLHQIAKTQGMATSRNGIPQALGYVNTFIQQVTKAYDKNHTDMGSCPTIIQRLDDESFLHDGLEFPTEHLCVGPTPGAYS